ncbi:Heterokaryon incompatibility protein [Hyphodiscus hymeniophilus]|uniref:Heterokaryon incompatibility protein n=1 Tax=Hyphodiscus hymeniophilus TaxID=353542 RepID=A0A9P6VFR5_9HELO|nr:Heterokaryon incompatibility protein [Hyphodiscus hymeniophilus]
MAETYTYTPIDSAAGQIRLLTVAFDVKQTYGHSNIDPLRGSLKPYYLSISSHPRAKRLVRSVRLPTFFALSYAWGDPARTHEILIDGKKQGITENLYNALRDLQRDGIGDIKVWADAICINQDDLGERSDQVFLMREIYHSAAEVRIWLGPSTKNGLRCMNFIAELTGGFGYIEDPLPGSEILSRKDEKILRAILIPGAAIGNAGYGFGQSIIQIAEAMAPEGRDDKAKMISDPDGNLSLHRETVEELSKWRPTERRLRKVEDVDFTEIASMIDENFIQMCAWFERMWVVQELGVAESAGIAYGGAVESWQNFLRAVYYLHYTCSAPIANIRKLTGLEKIRMGWNNRLRQPLQELIRECRYRRATDPRDKIYSLLSLMGDRMSPLLQPDYTKSLAEVYAHATQHLIKQSESLDSICGWQTIGREDLPSWVPDYNLNQDLAASPLVSIDGRENIFAASGYDHRSKYALHSSSITEWTGLSVTGLCIDTVSISSDAAQEDDSFGSIERIWQSTILAAGHLLNGLTRDVEICLENLSSAVTKYSEHWNATGKLYSQSLSSNSKVNLSVNEAFRNQPIVSEDQKIDPNFFDTYILDAYIQSLVCGRQTTNERLSKEHARALVNLPSEEFSASGEQEEILGLICRAFNDGMRGRSMGITSRGYIGVMPQDVRQGDLVCVLFGCSVPVVLRKRTDDSYIFIGESYLHGFMDAEAIVYQMKGTLKEQNFVLR